MALTPEQAVERARALHEQRTGELPILDEVRRYWMGRQRRPAVIPATAPAEIRILDRMARVNVVGIVVESLAQSLAVEGFRAERQAQNAQVWDVWQANQLDARQSIVHRACLAYGVAYAVVTPGDPVPVIRNLSPRKMTALYADVGDDWPVVALERRGARSWRLYDRTHVHELSGEGGTFEHVSSAEHQAGVTPVVRYLEVQDSDWDDEPTAESPSDAYARRPVIGQVAGLMTIQDQLDLATFDLLVAQHYAAFPQRVVIGWLAPSEEARLKIGTSQVVTFEDSPTDIKLDQWQAASLDGYLASRAASFRQAAALSQTPAHELIGDLVNLSAEALAAAEAGRDRKVTDRQTTIGEAHEQMLKLAGRMAGFDVPSDAQVVWRDTTARSFAATVDALGKVAQMLGVPVDELWERVPGVSQQDVERWRALRGDRPSEPVTADQANAYGTLVRSGVRAESARTAAGISQALDHTGLLPVTLQRPAAVPDAGVME